MMKPGRDANRPLKSGIVPKFDNEMVRPVFLSCLECKLIFGGCSGMDRQVGEWYKAQEQRQLWRTASLNAPCTRRLYLQPPAVALA